MCSGTLLVVDDSVADLDLIEKAYQKNESELEIIEKTGGQQALYFLEENQEPRPDLVLLDLDMPKVDGFDFLEKIRDKDKFRQLPVVVLTMSGAEEDIFRAYRKGANCCLTKPLAFEDLQEILSSIQNFWFNKAVLPSENLNLT